MRLLHLSLIALATAGCDPTTVVPDDAAPRLGATEFTELTEAIGRRSDRVLGASGEALLGEDDTPHRWARLDPEDPVRVRGAYVIEDGVQVWVVTYETDGRTEPWTAGRNDRAVEHVQAHHHGSESIRFALRGGQLVVLDYEFVEDTDSDETIRRHCTGDCPALRRFATEDMRLEVLGPAASIAELTR